MNFSLYANTRRVFAQTVAYTSIPYKAECDDTYNDNFTNSTTTHPITNDSVNYILSYQLYSPSICLSHINFIYNCLCNYANEF